MVILLLEPLAVLEVVAHFLVMRLVLALLGKVMLAVVVLILKRLMQEEAVVVVVALVLLVSILVAITHMDIH
jgi:dolichyl-phosphate-mannose--protein O-mannosyl transferase